MHAHAHTTGPRHLGSKLSLVEWDPSSVMLPLASWSRPTPSSRSWWWLCCWWLEGSSLSFSPLLVWTGWRGSSADAAGRCGTRETNLLQGAEPIQVALIDCDWKIFIFINHYTMIVLTGSIHFWCGLLLATTVQVVTTCMKVWGKLFFVYVAMVMPFSYTVILAAQMTQIWNMEDFSIVNWQNLVLY